MSDQNPENPVPPSTPPAYPTAPPYGQAPGAYPPPASGAYPPPAAPGYTPYPSTPKTNTLAIVSLVASLAGVFILPFIGQIVGVITGHMGLKQIKDRGENGRGLALAGVIIGYVTLALTLIVGVFLLLAFIAAVNSGEFYEYQYSS